MTSPDMSEARQAAESLLSRTVQSNWAQIVAGVFSVCGGDLQIAEDAVQDASVAAITSWPRDGAPLRPEAWLITAGRRKAIDRLRRQQNLMRKLQEVGLSVELQESGAQIAEDSSAGWPDDRLRLIFTCCHPSLSLEAQVALTLRVVAGLATEEIARAFLLSDAALSKRLTRAKQKVRDARIPYRIPSQEDLGGRLAGVLKVIYLIFNEGYASTTRSLLRADLCEEAIALARLVSDLLPDEPETCGLLALMLFNHSRHAARADAEGNLLVLDQQDRSLWDRRLIQEAISLLQANSGVANPGPYQIQASIAQHHSTATSPDQAAWPAVVELYDRLYRILPTPVVLLNRASAISFSEGSEAGLRELAALEAARSLEHYHYLHAAKADFLRRANRPIEAVQSYRRALSLCANPVESRYLESRISELAARGEDRRNS